MYKRNQNLIFFIVSLILTILVSYYFYNKSNNSELIIEQEFPVSIIKKPSELKDLEIFYKNDTIHSLNKINLNITNNSNKPISENDFISPLKIELLDSIRIISIEIEKTIPKGISAHTDIDSSKSSFNLRFDLMNPEDKIKIGILFEGEISNIDSSARIKGVKKITYTKKSYYKFRRQLPLFVIMFISLFLWSSMFTNEDYSKASKSIKLLEYEKRHPYKFKTKEDLIKNLESLYSSNHHTEKSLKESFSNIESIFNSDDLKEEDKMKISFNHIIEELKENKSFNLSFHKISMIIVILGLLYLALFTFDHISGSKYFISSLFN